jgi:hypothetical protein
MKCHNCGRPLADEEKCRECGAVRPTVAPAFIRAEETYLRLREQYEAGKLSSEQFKSAVESEMIDFEGRYWMLGVNSGKWYVLDGKAWRDQDPPLAPTVPSAATSSAQPERPKSAVPVQIEDLGHLESSTLRARRGRAPVLLAIIGAVAVSVIAAVLVLRRDTFLEQKPEKRFLDSARVGDTAAVKSFLAAGMDPNTRSASSGITALIMAASNGHTDTVTALIAGGADVNARFLGETALMGAAAEGHTDTVTALIAGGADVNARSSSDWTALKFARANGHTEIVRILQQAGDKE